MDLTAIHGRSLVPHLRLYPNLSSFLRSKALTFPSCVTLSSRIPRTILQSACYPLRQTPSPSPSSTQSGVLGGGGEEAVVVVERWKLLAVRVLLVGAAVGLLVMRCRGALAAAGGVGEGVEARGVAWVKVLQVLKERGSVLKEQGSVLAGLLRMSVFFLMAETLITTLWLWKCS